MDGFDEVRFSLAIITGKEINSGSENHLGGIVISKTGEG
jgi:hypothetical protein